MSGKRGKYKGEIQGFFAALRMTNFLHSSLVGELFREEVEVDGFAHGFVAGVAGVEVVAGVI